RRWTETSSRQSLRAAEFRNLALGHQGTKHLFIARRFIVLIKMKLSVRRPQEFSVMEEDE
ncbi:hypothetical protein DS259_23860, partial [Salmonella enterica subsp. indica]|nr:hypothetical protein [Salmonella enterica subsp. indica]